MADISGQLIPVVSALAGVALTLLGNVLLERSKWRQSQRSEQRVRSLESLTELLQAITDIARTLRQTAEQIDEGRDVDMKAVADRVDDLIGQARRQGTVARIVGPHSTLGLITSLEGQIAPIYRLVAEAGRLGNGAALIEPARQLMKTRDAFVDHLRRGYGMSWS
ncbi:hypothetical protein [Streptomyces erythrochromogenes]|uniref:hypothetical protein n=1 Tax=Streptomyces erythrochromogenes TaxID=285574 RepID=UPI003687F1BF